MAEQDLQSRTAEWALNPEKDLQWRNAEWTLQPGPDGKLSAESVTHALLIDVRGALHQIRGMLRFFTVLAVLGLMLGLVSVLLK